MNDFSIGRALASTLKVWLRNFVPFMLLSGLVYAPLAVFTYLLVNGQVEMSLVTVSLVAGLGTMLLGFVLTSTLVYGVVMQLRGRPAPIGMCLSIGLQRLFPVLGVSLLVGLCVAGGMILLIVPGIILFCMFYVAVPASVVERPGILGALKRSRELTADRRGAIFGMLVLTGGAGWLAGKLLETAVSPETSLQTYLWSNFILQVVISSFGAVLQGVVYHDLRLAKEGAHTEDLARVFD